MHLAYGDTVKFYNNTSSCIFKDDWSHDSFFTTTHTNALAYGDTLKFYNNASSCIFNNDQSCDSFFQPHV